MPRLVPGEAIIRCATTEAESEEEARATAVRVHLFSHRYGRPKETRKDKLTYHSAILLEWDHAKYTTVVELAVRAAAPACTSQPLPACVPRPAGVARVGRHT